MKGNMLKGEITAFLSLIFVLLLSFISAVIQSASIQVSKNTSRVVVTEAVESVFAEYQKELLEEYDVFSMDASYETGSYAESQITDRLEFYGTKGMNIRIKKLQLLTDNHGQAFKEQVVYYMKHKYGISAFENLTGDSNSWKEQEIAGEKYQKTDKETTGNLNAALEENGGSLPDTENPLTHISQLKSSGFLQLVMPGETSVSHKSIELSSQPSRRSLHKGHGTFEVDSSGSSSLSNMMFGAYLKEHFSHAGESPEESGKEGGALDYEIEYILEGKSSDKENLEGVAKKLLFMRLGPNYAFLMSSPSKQAEATSAALTLSTAAGLPVAEGVVKQALLVAWAYGESVMDVQSLLGDNKVPMIKSEESWQLDLDGLLKLGTAEDVGDGKDTEGGLDYEAYLTMLLFLEKEEQTTMRSLDVIEQNLQVRKGCKFFYVDQCMNRIEIQTKVRLQRGITYTFPTFFTYQ